MNYVAAMLLIHVKDEELTFWVFFSVMRNLNWRYMYLERTPKLIKMIDGIKERLR